MNYETIVKKVIEEYKVSPVDMLGIGDDLGEYTYLNNLKDSYIRTIRDLDSLFKENKSSKKILEIGSFLGVVSISLKRLGFSVQSLDIPEFHQSSKLKEKYGKNGIQFDGLNLRTSNLPYESDSFDAVIICEVIEHLNFNPLPVLKEINRVLKKDGLVYIGMPNQTSLSNRIKLFLGQSIHNPIEDFFNQLNKKKNMIVGLHWREYTLNETTQIIESMGFNIVRKYYFSPDKISRENILKTVLKRVIYTYHPFRPFHVVIGEKKTIPTHDFWRTDANS